jgi:integrase
MTDSNINALNELIDKIGAENLTPTSTELLIKAITNNKEEKKEVSGAKITSSEKTKEIESNILQEKKESKKSGIVTRPLELDEFEKIIILLNTGFEYVGTDNKKHKFRPQPDVALAVSLEATLGLRISDVLRLKVKNFKKNRLEILEKKTNKLQYREINPEVSDYIRDYALNNNLGLDDYIIKVKTRWIQSRIKIVREYLELTNISTHSFRKLFANYIYNESKGDIELVKNLLNHSSITVTQQYLRTSQQKMDEYSKSINFLHIDVDDQRKD